MRLQNMLQNTVAMCGDKNDTSNCRQFEAPANARKYSLGDPCCIHFVGERTFTNHYDTVWLENW